jgi:hypothetical protein
MNDDQAEGKSKTSRWTTEGILLALASSLAYYFTYLYEQEYVTYYGIPDDFIDIRITVLIAVLSGMLLLGIVLFILTNSLSSIVSINDSYYGVIIVEMALLIFPITMILLYGYNSYEGRMSAIMAGVLILYDLLSLTKRRISGKRPRKHDIKTKDEINQRTFNRVLSEKMGTNVAALIMFVFLGCIVASSMGKAAAAKKTEFLVTSTKPAMVVLKTYGDYLICAPYDVSKKTVEKNFSILKLADDKKLMLSVNKIGPLEPKDSK